MGDPHSSFYSFLVEPMVDLEPRITQERDMLASFNIQLEQNVRQTPANEDPLLVSAIENTQGQGETSAKDKKNAQPRTSTGRLRISLYQKLELENVFRYTPYPTRTVRAQLAHKLGLRHQTVLNWFKKRRYHWRKQRINRGEPVPFLWHVPDSQVHVFYQYPVLQETFHYCYQEPCARHQGSQQPLF